MIAEKVKKEDVSICMVGGNGRDNDAHGPPHGRPGQDLPAVRREGEFQSAGDR
jgi:hypothetical protein